MRYFVLLFIGSCMRIPKCIFFLLFSAKINLFFNLLFQPVYLYIWQVLLFYESHLLHYTFFIGFQWNISNWNKGRSQTTAILYQMISKLPDYGKKKAVIQQLFTLTSWDGYEKSWAIALLFLLLLFFRQVINQFLIGFKLKLCFPLFKNIGTGTAPFI